MNKLYLHITKRAPAAVNKKAMLPMSQMHMSTKFNYNQNQTQYVFPSAKKMLLGASVAAAASVFAYYKNEESRLNVAECAYSAGAFSDKNLQLVMKKVDEGLDDLYKKYPTMQKVKVNHGLRGIRYFVEFPIVGQNIDAFSLLTSTQQKMAEGKNNRDANLKITGNDSYLAEENVAYLIDYKVKSQNVDGAMSAGSVYIRGVKGHEGYDSFKFILEKANDFINFDAEIILNAYEQALKPRANSSPISHLDESKMTPAQIKFAKRQAAKNSNQAPAAAGMAGLGGLTGQPQSQDDSDPVSVLEKHSCSVFMPDTQRDVLTWEYLAGYGKIKRDIEDTVLLALTHGDVYDQITQATRMKNETNRPKCVLFEGPPGCGKTTSAKIISQQVAIPLVYMPLEAIMSKYYGESESRLAEIFEAAGALGSVILFIDEIDSLATSREAGLHEATRRILSTLLRKIDSFESEGEVLVICATNRKKDLDPALVSRLDLSIRFDLPDAATRAQIFQRYAKQLSESELKQLAEMAVHLSGRDISDICKDAERKWASKYIRKEVTTLAPSVNVYMDSTKNRLVQMADSNLRMDGDFNPELIALRNSISPMANRT